MSSLKTLSFKNVLNPQAKEIKCNLGANFVPLKIFVLVHFTPSRPHFPRIWTGYC
jgi:hypothetical protein